MAKRIVTVVGCKGGVGKTTTAKALVDLLLEGGENVVVIDADRDNPGLFKTYDGIRPVGRNTLVVEALNLDSEDGWSAFLDVCHAHPDHVVVLDTPAGNHGALTAHGDILYGNLSRLERELHSLFVTDGKRDSIELMKDYLELTPPCVVVHAVLNGFYGDERAFANFRSSNARGALEARGGKSVPLAALAGHVVNEVDWHRLSYSDAMKKLSFGNQAVLGSWRGRTHKALAQLQPTAR